MKNLIEILAEKPFPGKALTVAPKLRVQQIDNASRALAFAESCGVTMELKCSAENLCDGLDKQILGLVWAIMRYASPLCLLLSARRWWWCGVVL